ncbi:hypothetical protein KBZ10_10410 [Streptomyces sp. F63]|nr:hypothetical protein [Streptomyces sp. F63]MBQ0984921.1 hypothetical protein [Streptomyces sp. F63]
MPGHESTPAELRDAANEMDATGHPIMARLLRDEVDDRERSARPSTSPTD